MWLWIVPLGIWFDAHRATAARWVRPTVLCALAYQAVLAARWLPDPSILQSRVEYLVWQRRSLFAVPLRYSLPHFYGASLDYLPNLIWTLAALLLLATGVLLTSPGARRTLRRAWTAAAVAAAMLLPVEPTADSMSDADEERERALDLSLRSIITQRFEAERLPPRSMATATTRRDPAASAGAVRAATPLREDGVAVFGPYLTLDAGRYRVVAALRLEAPAGGRAARFEVRKDRSRTRLAALDVPASRLRNDGEWSLAAITFETAEAMEDVEFVIHATPGVDLLIDYVELTPVLPQPGRPTPTVITELLPPP